MDKYSQSRYMYPVHTQYASVSGLLDNKMGHFLHFEFDFSLFLYLADSNILYRYEYTIHVCNTNKIYDDRFCSIDLTNIHLSA